MADTSGEGGESVIRSAPQVRLDVDLKDELAQGNTVADKLSDKISKVLDVRDQVKAPERFDFDSKEDQARAIAQGFNVSKDERGIVQLKRTLADGSTQDISYAGGVKHIEHINKFSKNGDATRLGITYGADGKTEEFVIYSKEAKDPKDGAYTRSSIQASYKDGKLSRVEDDNPQRRSEYFYGEDGKISKSQNYDKQTNKISVTSYNKDGTEKGTLAQDLSSYLKRLISK